MRSDVAPVATLTVSSLHPCGVSKPAIVGNAAALILIHNHPSGDPEPSAQDRALTRRLREAGDLLGIRILDHVVIGDSRFRSFVDAGLF